MIQLQSSYHQAVYGTSIKGNHIPVVYMIVAHTNAFT